MSFLRDIWDGLKAVYSWLLSWCSDSETIALARGFVVYGFWLVLDVIMATPIDQLGVMDFKSAALWIGWGVAQEAIRRFRAEDL